MWLNKHLWSGIKRQFGFKKHDEIADMAKGADKGEVRKIAFNTDRQAP